MEKHILRINGLLVVLAFFGFFVHSSAQDEMEELKSRMKTRYAEINELKQSGKIGENPMGFVEAVNEDYEKDQTVSRLIIDENQSRASLYALIAKDSGISATDVGIANARRIFRKSAETVYFKSKEGTWERKRDLDTGYATAKR